MSRVRSLFLRRYWLFPLVLSIVLLILNLVVAPQFGNPQNWPAILATLAPFVLVGFASTPSVLSGGIDVSVGPLTTFINCLFVAVLIPMGLGDPLIALPVLLGTAILVGVINGILITVLRLHPVVATTGMLFILMGLSLIIARTPVAATPNWSDPLSGVLWVIPGALITMGAAGLVWFILRRTAFTANLLAVGDDDASAFGAGINVTAVRIVAYAVGGLFAGIAGIALSSLIRSSESSLATTYALIGLAAVVLGGTPLGGGRGGLVGTLFGAIAIYLLQQFLTAAGVQSNLVQFAYGFVLVAGVVLGATLLTQRPGRKFS